MQVPPIDHLVALTDDAGILQHASWDVPNRAHGYCTDDVGRALLVACSFAARPETASEGARLVRTYLAYLADAQLPDGGFHDFLGYDRRWQDDAGTPDAVGRAVWGLGYAEAHAPRPSWRSVAGALRARALPALASLRYIRSHAYTMLGLAHALGGAPADADAVRAQLELSAATIADAFDAHRGPGWIWCEDMMTYDNARLCEALLRAGTVLSAERFSRVGLAMLEFLVGVSFQNEVFVPVGNEGWFPRGGVKARYGQQPIEAAGMTEAALLALDVTGDERWRSVAAAAHGWFLGTNTEGAVVAQPDGGCCDGLDHGRCNGNMGAESTLAYLMSAFAMARRAVEALPLAT